VAYREIVVEEHEGVGRIVFNRPTKLNAFTFELLGETLEAFQKFESDRLRVVQFTGRGRAFSAGDDLSGMGGSDPLQDIRAHHHNLVKRVRAASFPVVAVLNGYALGAAFDLALACDFRLAAREAQLGDVRVKRAMNSMSGAAYWLPRLVGVAKATEILLLGERMSADEALRLGLVNKVVPSQELEAAADSFCGRLLDLPPVTLVANRACIDYGLSNSLADALDHEARLLVKGFETDDWREGMASFLEKRPARFRGR